MVAAGDPDSAAKAKGGNLLPTPIQVPAVAMGVATPPVAGAADAVPAKPTFTKDIAPIFQEKCEACHRPDSIAPMSLVTYEDARPWAKSIRAVVALGKMPPWHAEAPRGIG